MINGSWTMLLNGFRPTIPASIDCNDPIIMARGLVDNSECSITLCKAAIRVKDDIESFTGSPDEITCMACKKIYFRHRHKDYNKFLISIKKRRRAIRV